jgi:hypothetical protein
MFKTIEVVILGRKYQVRVEQKDSTVMIHNVVTGGEDITSSLTKHEISLFVAAVKEKLYE